MEILHQLESGDEIVTLEKGGRAGRKKKVSTYMVDVPNQKKVFAVPWFEGMYEWQINAIRELNLCIIMFNDVL